MSVMDNWEEEPWWEGCGGNSGGWDEWIRGGSGRGQMGWAGVIRLGGERWESLCTESVGGGGSGYGAWVLGK